MVNLLVPLTGYLVLMVCCVLFPHVFTYAVGRNISLAIVILGGGFDYYTTYCGKATNRTGRIKSFYNKYASWMLLVSISIFCITALNEKLYDAVPSKHSFWNGVFTIGGVMPYSDNAGYLLSIQSFIDYGLVIGTGVYRPLASLVNAVLYALSGQNMIIFYYLTTSLVIFGIWYACSVVARNVCMAIALMAGFALCLYFPSFIGTFLTEITGGIVGLIALALLINGLFKKRLSLYCVGLVLLGLSMQMRAGAIFFIPLLIAYGAFHFRKRSWVSIRTLIVSGVVVIISFLAPSLQLAALSERNEYHTNVGFVIYQIQVDAASWVKMYEDYPKVKSGSCYEEAKLSYEIAIHELKRDPVSFFRNYFRRLYKIAKKPGEYVFHFSKEIPDNVKTALIILFPLTPVLYRRRNGIHFLFWLTVLGLMGSLMSSPMLDEVRERSYAASVGINSVVFAIAIHNCVRLAQTLRGVISVSMRRIFHNAGKWLYVKVKGSLIQDIQSGNGIIKKFPFIVGVLTICAIILGPILLDEIRTLNISGDRCSRDSLASYDSSVFLLSVQKSPYVLVLSEDGMSIRDPRIIPRRKFIANNPMGMSINDDFYLFNAIDRNRFMERKGACGYVLLEKRLLGGRLLECIDMLAIKGEYVQTASDLVFIAREILGIVVNR